MFLFVDTLKKMTNNTNNEDFLMRIIFWWSFLRNTYITEKKDIYKKEFENINDKVDENDKIIKLLLMINLEKLTVDQLLRFHRFAIDYDIYTDRQILKRAANIFERTKKNKTIKTFFRNKLTNRSSI